MWFDSYTGTSGCVNTRSENTRAKINANTLSVPAAAAVAAQHQQIIQVERRTREIPPAGRFGGTSYTMGLAWNVKSSEGEGLYRCYSEEPTEYPFTLGAELVFETDRKFFQLNRTRLLLSSSWSQAL
uniref:Uncharacterized protein n=1 Tax=Vespula pensylvanica TaxID=30213 RepID=A0A834UGN1_VESPE|nr:hypothetical protein H0235_000875 [Vespula pensylvanica]